MMSTFIKYFSFSFVAGLLVCAGQANATDAITDIRTVIDVSGSMKKNDPSNLRIPALKLLVELMPEGTRAGVWTFGQYVNMNVKQGRVDAHWKKLARAEAAKIHSRGLYTNIEDALRKASFDWTKPDAGTKRNLILLTDGVVDIAKDAKLNMRSRQRIIEELLPQFKKAGARLHTIALSRDADHQLLKEMSALTGGWYERVDSAAQLHKVFLRLFEKSAPVDTLPIKANKFNVDKHVKDMTLVLFHSSKGQSAKIITPDNKTLSSSKHGKTIRWHQEQGYELVTVKQPQTGEWRLQTEVDPENRVMVVTNLRLKVAALPNSLLSGDELIVRAHLAEDGKNITRHDFLKLVDFKLSQEHKTNGVLTVDMRDDGNKPDDLGQDGVYNAHLWNSLRPGKHLLSVTVTGPTFKRQFRHLLQVFDTPANLEIHKGQHGDFKLLLTPHGEVVQLSSVSAQVKLPDGKRVTFTQNKTNEWTAVIPNQYQDKVIAITLIGTRTDDKPLKLNFERILSLKAQAKVLHLTEKVKPSVTEMHEAKPVVENKQVKEEHKKQLKPVKTKEKQTRSINWIFVMSMTLLINIVIIVAGFFGYKYWKKRHAEKDAEEESEMEL